MGNNEQINNNEVLSQVDIAASTLKADLISSLYSTQGINEEEAALLEKGLNDIKGSLAAYITKFKNSALLVGNGINSRGGSIDELSDTLNTLAAKNSKEFLQEIKDNKTELIGEVRLKESQRIDEKNKFIQERVNEIAGHELLVEDAVNQVLGGPIVLQPEELQPVLFFAKNSINKVTKKLNITSKTAIFEISNSVISIAKAKQKEWKNITTPIEENLEEEAKRVAEPYSKAA